MKNFLINTFILTFLIQQVSAVPPFCNFTANDYVLSPLENNEIVAILTNPLKCANRVRLAREYSNLVTSLNETVLSSNLQQLLKWQVQNYANGDNIFLSSGLPSGKTAGGTERIDLERTYWIENSNLYGYGALLNYSPRLGKALRASSKEHRKITFDTICPTSQSWYVIGVNPINSLNSTNAHCRYPIPGTWQRFKSATFSAKCKDTVDKTVKTISMSREGILPEMISFRNTSARDLFKYGCLRQVVLGNLTEATIMLRYAIDTWDTHGFYEKKPGIYHTRLLAYFLLCINALGLGEYDIFTGFQKEVSKSDVETALWNTQDVSGGMWTGYCVSNETPCISLSGVVSPVPKSSKVSNEIATLTLLAYTKFPSAES